MSRQRKTDAISSTAKGRIVERIVAQLHQFPGVEVERNVHLPVWGEDTRTREIDVLVTGDFSGYPVRIAIECKNEKGKIGSPKIDAFIGKLRDVGIPSQYGVYVSASGYTSGAISRAKKAGIRPLILSGLSSEQLRQHVSEAIYSTVVYLLANVTRINCLTQPVGCNIPVHQWAFVDRTGRFQGIVPDLIWMDWINGKIPLAVGLHDISIDVPSNWFLDCHGVIEPISQLQSTVRVFGVVVKVKGKAEEYSLFNAISGNLERTHIAAEFDIDERSQIVQVIASDNELDIQELERSALHMHIARFQIPRIRVAPFYWPPSERAALKVSSRLNQFRLGIIPNPHPFTTSGIEGDDFAAIWEPIWDEYPLLQRVEN